MARQAWRSRARNASPLSQTSSHSPISSSRFASVTASRREAKLRARALPNRTRACRSSSFRSHYERFRHFHETFYRAVEVASVTPFAARAMVRGLGGALVALARHAEDGMTPPAGAGRIRDFRASLHRLATDVFRNRVTDQPTLSDDEDRDAQLKSVCNRIDGLLDDWAQKSSGVGHGSNLRYQEFEDGGRANPVSLHGSVEGFAQALPGESFRANRSLRDVEPAGDLALLES